MSYLDIFMNLGLRYQLIFTVIILLILGSIISSRSGSVNACAWCGRAIQGKAEKCSLCDDKFCSQKCVNEHIDAKHALGY